MLFSLRHLRFFVNIVEQGSVSAASKQLSVAASSIVVAMQDLERNLGYQLLTRHARGMELTVKGHQFLRHATKILSAVADAERALSEDPEAPVGGSSLALGVTPLVAGYILSDLLARFRRAFPHIDVQVTEDSHEDLEHLLIGGELDTAVMVLPSDWSSTALDIQIVRRSAYRVWLPLGHRLTASDVIDIASLVDEPQIQFLSDEIVETVEIIWQRAGLRRRPAVCTRSIEAVRSLVATGAGLSIMPDIAYRTWSLEGDKIEARALNQASQPLVVGAATRRGAPLNMPAQSFLQTVGAYRSLHGA